MKIKIDYLPNTREAKLTTDDNNSKVWIAIKRACQDNTDTNLITKKDKEIKLPWWSFLLAKESIGYHIARNNTEVEFSDIAKSLLEQALRKEDLFQIAKEANVITDDFLKQKLSEYGFTRPLTKEQHRNVKKLASLPACATFSVPGAGKTTEALAYYCCRRRNTTKLLIVCPKNAYAVWEEQIATIFPGENINVVRLIGGINNIQNILKKPPDVALVSYMQLSYAENIIANYLISNEVFVFLDESHRMKRGDDGAIGASILSLAHLPEAKCILSGTPLPNSIADLVPQFRFLYPEVPSSVENIKDLIKPIYVRTTKRQLDIPPVTRILTKINLSPAQRTLYQLLCSELVREGYPNLSAIDRRKLRSLGKSALRLIQLVSNPTLLAKKINFEHKELLNAVLEEGDSPKIEYVMNKARLLASAGNKTIIWSSFVANVELVAARLIDLGADFIHGGVEAGSEDEEFTRERKIKRFHDDKNAFVLIANPAACSEGISLHTVCHHAIYLDRNYNAAQYLQSEDRIHRLGLKPTDKTTVEILYCPDTIDESVLQRLTKKIGIMADVLDDPDLQVDPIPYDPENDGEFDLEDAADFLAHIKAEANPI